MANPWANNFDLASFVAVVAHVVNSRKLGHTEISVPKEAVQSLDPIGREILRSCAQTCSHTDLVIEDDHDKGTVVFHVVPPVSAETLAFLSQGGDDTHTPRPKNAFVIFRLDNHHAVKAKNPALHNNDISRIIGKMWHDASQDVRDRYKALAEDEKRQHAIDHPGYQYQPRKSSQKKRRITRVKLASASNDSNQETIWYDANGYIICIDMSRAEMSEELRARVEENRKRLARRRLVAPDAPPPKQISRPSFRSEILHELPSGYRKGLRKFYKKLLRPGFFNGPANGDEDASMPDQHSV